MKVDVYDTYVRTEDGQQLHLDVLLPTDSKGQSKETAVNYVSLWLQTIDIDPQRVQLEQCRYCHSEEVSPQTRKDVEEKGFAIVQMEGCPAPDPLIGQ